MIYVVIPVLNRVQLTLACINSLQKNKSDFKVIVVDHGSTDGSDVLIGKHFPGVILLRGSERMWWAGATNAGVREALKRSDSDLDFVLTLNNDLEVDAGYLEQLLLVHHENGPCLVGSTSVDIAHPETITFAGIQWSSRSAKYTKPDYCKNPKSHLLSPGSKVATDLLPGRGTLIPIEVFQKIGLFDEVNFPHYAADEDFSLRARKYGYPLWVSTEAVVKSHIHHSGTATSGKLAKPGFLTSLVSMRSPNNLRHRYRWAQIHAQNPNLYFSLDMIRLLGSCCRSLFKK